MRSLVKSSLQAMALLLILSLSGIFGCVPTTTVNSINLDEILKADQFTGQPQPDWSTSLTAADVDFTRELDDQTIFLGTMMTRGYMQTWGLYQKEIMLVDLKNGEILWRLTRAELGSQLEGVLVTPQQLVVVGQSFEAHGVRMSCFDRKTGDRLWTHDTTAPSAYSLDEINGQIVVGIRGENQAELKAFSAVDGKVRWEIPFTGITGAESKFDLHRFGNDIVLTGKGVMRVRLKDGRKAWAKETLSDDLTEPLTVALSGNNLTLSSNAGFGILRYDTGKEAWSHGIGQGEIIGHDGTASDLILKVRSADKTSMALQAFSIKSGKQIWKLPLDSDLRSPLLSEGKTSYFTTKNKTYAILNSSGKRKFVQELPDFMRSEIGLMDQLLIRKGDLIVAREQGIVSLSSQSGKTRFSHAVGHGEIFSYQYLSQKYALRTVQGTASKDRAATYLALNQNLRDQIVRSQTGVDASLTNHVGYGSGFEVAAQAAVFAQSMVSVGAAFRQGAVNENLKVNRHQIVAARSAQEKVLQNGYFLRPFYRDGWGVTLIRLADGKRCELYTSAPNEPLLVNGGNLPVYLIDQSGKSLYTVGIGIKPDMTNTYEKVGFDLDVYKTWPGIPNNWIIPYAGLQKTKFSDLTFTQAKRSAPEISVVGPKEKSLREMILNGNVDKVEELVEAGADVNAVDPLGFNSLFYAGITDNKKIVKYLVKKGADATRRDHGGLLAYHYTFLTHAMNKSTGVIRSAYLDQEK